MEVIIKESKIQFRNPQIGQPTRAVEEHYNGRRIVALIDGEEKMYRLKKDDIGFYADEGEMMGAVLRKEENNSKKGAE